MPATAYRVQRVPRPARGFTKGYSWLYPNPFIYFRSPPGSDFRSPCYRYRTYQNVTHAISGAVPFTVQTTV